MNFNDNNPGSILPAVNTGKRLIVIGGGAAGFFCAINAARLNPYLKVTILEKTHNLLSKVKVSGGGRCNVTHSLFEIIEMSKRYPRGQNVVKKTFHQFFTTDTIKWFEERDIQLKAESDGRMFPVTDSSQTIIDCLLKEANKYNVSIKIRSEVKDLERKEGWKIKLENGETLEADYVCIASGGYAKSSMFEWIKKLGHTIAEPVPSLFTFNLPKHPITTLMGVSVEKVRLKIEANKLTEEGPLLITHWGLSGPGVLRLSAWGARELAEKKYEFKVHINWLSEYNESSLKLKFQQLRMLNASRKVVNADFTELPNRLWLFLVEQSGINRDIRFADLPAKHEQKLIKNLVDYIVEIKGKTTFKEEFVTAGGVETSEVDVNKMMSKVQPDLFFAGEILNVDGITGGYNFQHAWTSGWIAAKSIAQSASLKMQ
ncbi:MAG TPA: NAD(P)/FAD-dependent oxidoreductase [Flavisolibacter sp.]|nr:NAD(P)/FAD-dependent oxidoreductase [Flavisolibacter sp.]